MFCFSQFSLVTRPFSFQALKAQPLDNLMELYFSTFLKKIFFFFFVYETFFFLTVIKLFSYSLLLSLKIQSFVLHSYAFSGPGMGFWIQGEIWIWFAVCLFFPPTLRTNFPGSIYWDGHLFPTVPQLYFCPTSNLHIHVNLVLDVFHSCIGHLHTLSLVPGFLHYYSLIRNLNIWESKYSKLSF